MSTNLNNNLLGSLQAIELEEHFDAIRNILSLYDTHLSYLEKENRQLKAEAYKDAEISRLSKLVKIMQADMYRGFPISESEMDAIMEWRDKHEREAHGIITDEDRIRAAGVSGGGYTYEFLPTAIGTSGSIRCSRCGAEFEFQEIS